MTQPYKNNLLLDRLNGHQTAQIPVWLMRQAGRHLPGYKELRKQEPDFLSFVRKPHLTSAAALEPIQRYDLDAAIVFSDILTIPHWLGWPVQFNGHTGIQIPAMQSMSDVSQLDISQLRRHLANWHAMADLRQHITDRPIIGFVGAPWTLVCYCLSSSKDQFSRARQILAQNPDWFQQLLQILTSAIKYSIDTQVAQGADVIMVFDSWAGLCTPSSSDVLSPYMHEIIDHISSHHVPSILFAKGQSYNIQSQFSPQCITLDWSQSPPANPNCAIQGLFDPALLLTDPHTIEKTIEETIGKINTHRYIANLGHGLLPHTPPELVSCFVENIRKVKVRVYDKTLVE